ncbi:aminopeptidase [Thermodesulfobacteriota bacterium]
MQRHHKMGSFGLSLKVIITTVLIFLLTGCRISYLLQAASGQFHLLNNAIPIEEALEKKSLTPQLELHLRLVSRITEFGEEELGLKKTDSYRSVYLKSQQRPLYTVSASPKDRLVSVTWWFPVVGRVPYLGFFELEGAKEEKRKLLKKDLDVVIGQADAYSTLGWFNDPVTMSLLEGSTSDLVETILHEMTHTTLYFKGQGEFNEGLASLVGKVGAVLFFKKNYGPHHPFTIKAEKLLADERVFSAFLGTLFHNLNALYNSPADYSEKLAQRETVFSESRGEFRSIEKNLQTTRFIPFGHGEWNNAYLLSIGLYHRHFLLLETVLERNENSVRKTLAFFQSRPGAKDNALEEARRWLDTDNAS